MRGNSVIIGITGGIAAYKAAELVRLMVKGGADVKVAMTENATRFVTPMTFEALSGNRVVTNMWGNGSVPMDHITWGQESDLIIIAPATADFIGKMAHGIGDDFLSTMVLAATAKIMVCPSMNSEMFMNPAVRDNIRLLKERGCDILEPTQGELACGTEGPGRLPEPETILERAEMLVREQDLSGRKVLVTAGPTVEPFDPVRYLTNRSSGKMGYAIARVARQRGAEVILVSGPTSLEPPLDVILKQVSTTEEMRDMVFENRDGCDAIIKAAAVSDYRAKEIADHKIKKVDDERSLKLVRNPDILAELGASRAQSNGLLVGFAAETEDLITNATDKLNRKNVDMIIANDVSREDAGFESDTNQVKIIFRDGQIEDLPMMSKDEVADQILDRIKVLWNKTS